MDFGLAFSYPFQDKDWIQKILLTGVISLIPIVGQIAVLGWLIEITARVIRGESDPMPKWEDFGGLFMSGLKAFALGFIFGLPLMIIAFPAAIIDMLVDSESAAVVFSLLLACLSCLSIIYGLALAFIIPAAYGELAATGSLGSALNIGTLIERIRKAPAAYLLAFLGIFVASFLAGFGVILCFVGVLFTGAYAYAVEAHLFGQAYLQATSAS
ncbi:MAG TPA: DUF4013 domain-containing protein [Chloroflexi bacterium]|nr:DUF4013 domain-containing protein [Chloroflexota bacterium]